jgi:hypothetical protein
MATRMALERNPGSKARAFGEHTRVIRPKLMVIVGAFDHFNAELFREHFCHFIGGQIGTTGFGICQA